MTRLSKEFPELATLLAEDLNDVMSSGGSSVDASQLTQQFNSRIEEIQAEVAEKERKRELRDLTREHKDWREIAMYVVEPETNTIRWSNPAFGNYVATLPVDEQNKLVNVWDAEFVSQKLSGFKEWSKPKPVPVPQKNKRTVVEDATLPRGSIVAPPSNDFSEEEAAYRAEMAKR